MRGRCIGDATLVYSCGEGLAVKEHLIAYPELGSLNRAVEEIERKLDDVSREPYWLAALRQVKRFRFECCAVPRTHEQSTESAGALVDWLRQYLKPAPQMYPDLAGEIKAVLRSLERVRDARADHLLGRIIELWGDNTGSGTAILVKAPRLVAIAAETWKSAPELVGCQVLSPIGLGEDMALEHLIVCGPPRWFDDWVFTAPRARTISILCYDWVSTRWGPRVSFIASVRQTTPRKSGLERLANAPRAEAVAEPESIDFGIDLAAVRELAKKEAAGEDDDDAVDARAFVLEGDQVVFLEDDETATALAVDPDEDGDRRIHRVLVRDIEPGMFLLIRTEGGGDYIVPVANRILGRSCQSARALQKAWKDRLRAEVKRRGLEATVVQLRTMGSLRASAQNVRNWMSPRGIKTHDPRDFEAIMRLISMEAESGNCWNVMTALLKAHMRAGALIRRMLLNQVRGMDLSILRQDGRIDFELEDADAGKLAALLVHSIARETTPVVHWRIGNPISLDEDHGADVPLPNFR